MFKWTRKLKAVIAIVLACCVAMTNTMLCMAESSDIVGGDETSMDTYANSQGFATTQDYLDSLMDAQSEEPSGGVSTTTLTNTTNIDSTYIKDVSVTEDETDGISVCYAVDKSAVENDINNLLTGENKYLNVSTKIKATPSATHWKLEGKGDGSVSEGYVELWVTIYDNNDNPGHFAGDKIDGIIYWYSDAQCQTCVGETKLSISWEEYKISDGGSGTTLTNTTNIGGKYIRDISVTENETDGISVCYTVDKDAVETDINQLLTGEDKYLNVGTKIKATPSATRWKLGENRNGNVDNGYAEFWITIYDNKDNPGHFTEDNINETIRWYSDAECQTCVGETKLSINWKGYSSSGGGGSEGEGSIYHSDRELNLFIIGWDNNWNTDNGGNPIEYSVESGVHEICINVKPELWQRVYNNIDQANGIQLGMYLDAPGTTGEVKWFNRDYRGGTDDDTRDALMRSMLANDPMPIENNNKENAARISLMKINEDSDCTILKPQDENAFFGCAWFTSNSPKTSYEFDVGGEKKTFELVTFHITHKNKQDVAVTNESYIDERWLTYDYDKTYEEVNYSTLYQMGRLTYTLNGDMMDAESARYYNKNLVTRLNIPNATDLTFEKIDSDSQNLTWNKVLDGVYDISAEVLNQPTGEFRYRISYDVNDVHYSKILTIYLVRRYSANDFDNVGFTPVKASQITFDPTTIDSNRGFYYETTPEDHGEIVTNWSGKKINIDNISDTMFVSAPEGKDYTGYKYWTAEGGIDLHNGNTGDKINIRDNTLLQQSSHSLENGGAHLRTFFFPYRFEVNGKNIYSLYCRSTGVDETDICVIAWEYEESGQKKYDFQYYYWTSEEGHTSICMPKNVHAGTGYPEPVLVELKNAEDEEIDKTGINLDIQYYGQSGGKTDSESGFDYYRIRLIDGEGKRVDLNGRKAVVKFLYPGGMTKETAEKAKFNLDHYTDATHTMKTAENISYESDGVMVILTSFSPFMLEWESGETKKAAPPEMDHKIDNPSPEQDEVLVDMLENEAVRETDSSLPDAIMYDQLFSANNINPEDVEDTETGLVLNIEDITGIGTGDFTIYLEIHPKMTVIIKNQYEPQKIDPVPDDYLNGSEITFRIPIPKSVDQKYAKINHKKNNGNVEQHICLIQTSNGEKFAELTVTEFSEFEVTFTDTPQSNTNSNTSSNTSSTGGSITVALPYSKYWLFEKDGCWYIKNSKGEIIKNSWFCDDAVTANSKNVWYLLGADGKMIANGLVQDASGNFYSLETNHNGYYGSLRYKNGTYNCNGQQIYLEFEQSHNGSFGAVKNQDGIEKLKAIYGVAKYGVNSSNSVYSSTF